MKNRKGLKTNKQKRKKKGQNTFKTSKRHVRL